MVVRPRFVWGPGDATVLPTIVEMVEAGKFAFIGGGNHRTSTTHVDNTVEGLVLAADKGRPGAAYFVTDGEPIVFREWIEKLLGHPGRRGAGQVRPEAGRGRAGRRRRDGLEAAAPLDGPPPLTRMAYWVSGLECTLDDSAARSELGYVPVITREQGLSRSARGTRLSLSRNSSRRPLSSF